MDFLSKVLTGVLKGVIFQKKSHFSSSVSKIHFKWSIGLDIRPRIKVSKISDHFISTCSQVQLDWFIKSRLVCGLPVIHAPRTPLAIIQEV
jgi:hypothetical protein